MSSGQVLVGPNPHMLRQHPASGTFTAYSLGPYGGLKPESLGQSHATAWLPPLRVQNLTVQVYIDQQGPCETLREPRVKEILHDYSRAVPSLREPEVLTK